MNNNSFWKYEKNLPGSIWGSFDNACCYGFGDSLLSILPRDGYGLWTAWSFRHLQVYSWGSNLQLRQWIIIWLTPNTDVSDKSFDKYAFWFETCELLLNIFTLHHSMCNCSFVCLMRKWQRTIYLISYRSWKSANLCVCKYYYLNNTE